MINGGKFNQRELDALKRKLSNLSGKRLTGPGLTDAMQKALIFLEGQIKMNIREKFERVTGALISQWGHKISSVTKNRIQGMVGTWNPYAKTHELGVPPVRIRAKRVRAMTVPLGNVHKKAIPPAHDLWAQNLTFVKKDIIFLRARGYGAQKPRPLYALRKEIRYIRPRPFIKPVVENQGKEVANLLGGSIDRSIKE